MMAAKGLAKLTEEIGELQIELGQLQQVIAKKMARMESDFHWDSDEPLSRRIEDEMGDVMGAMRFVKKKLDLDGSRIEGRAHVKYDRFHQWDQEDDAPVDDGYLDVPAFLRHAPITPPETSAPEVRCAKCGKPIGWVTTWIGNRPYHESCAHLLPSLSETTNPIRRA